jgi:hypothetical protein
MTLSKMLDQIGMQSHLWKSPDGSTALLLPHGGRILALYAPGSTTNFLWTHPVLESATAASAFYESDAWHNSGGDRTWLAPEVEFFLPEYPRRQPYFQPRQFDPGSYQLEIEDSAAIMQTSAHLKMYASGKDIQVTIRKEVSPASSPLLQTAAPLSDALEYAGYTLHTTLTLDETSGRTLAPIAVWNLLQLPHGGEMIIPTYSLANPISYMGRVSTEDLQISDRAIRYRMTAAGELKIGVQSLYTTGRVAYIYGSAEQKVLVVRNFAVNPSGKYVDTPFGAGSDSACAVQACNIRSDLGSFSELEYHTPAVSGTDGHRRRVDESHLWAFRGPETAILEAARRLVFPEI